VNHAAELTQTEIDQTIADLPDVQVAVEQEYKWAVGSREFLGTDRADPQALRRVLPLPGGAMVVSVFQHIQSSIYFDDGWCLAENDLALKALVNPGVFRNISWLQAKQTIRWVDGCRDSLEVSARVRPHEIHAAVRDHALLPVAHLERLCGRELCFDAYAATTQQRNKVHFRSADGVLFQATFDVSRTWALPHGEPVIQTWLEIEGTSSDLRPRIALDAWARILTAHLGVEPEHVSKAAMAARLAGWSGRD
jgi:hypothetical protein